MIRAISRFAARLRTTTGHGQKRWLGATAFALSLATLPAVAAEYPIGPDQQMVGEIRRYTVKEGEVLADIARHFDVGYTALVMANPGVDSWLPGAGREITIPSLYILPDAPHQGVVINLAQWRLYYFSPRRGGAATHPPRLRVIRQKTPPRATPRRRERGDPG